MPCAGKLFFAGCGNDCGCADTLHRMTVTGWAATGGYPPFQNRDTSPNFYGYLKVITIVNVWEGGEDYTEHTRIEESWIHPTIGDNYKWQVTYDGVLTQTWEVPSDYIYTDPSAEIPGLTIIEDEPDWLAAFNATLASLTSGTVGVDWTVETDALADAAMDYKRQSIGDPNIYAEVIATLENPVTQPGLAAAVAIADGCNFTCNSEIVLDRLDGTTVTKNAGFSDPNFGPNHIVRMYARGPGGAILRNLGDSYVTGAPDMHFFHVNNNAAGSAYGTDACALMVPAASLPLARHMEITGEYFGTRLWNTANKMKIAKGHAATEFERYSTNGSILGQQYLDYGFLSGSASCEPCYESADLGIRCCFEAIYYPDDTFTPGLLFVNLCPPSFAHGKLYFDFDGNGIDDDGYWFSAYIYLAGAPVRVDITGHSYEVLTDLYGQWGVKFPDTYAGPVTKTILTADARFLALFTDRGYTGFNHTQGANPEVGATVPSVFGAPFGPDGFEPTPP